VRRSMGWSCWALLVPLCLACGRSRGESGPGDETAGGPAAGGGGQAASGGNAAGGAGAEAAGGSHVAGGGTLGGAAGTGGATTGSAGGNALGGAAGESSSGGVAGELSSGGMPAAGASSGGTDAEGGAPGDPLEPVRVIRGTSDDPYWDLTIRGEGLDEYDGLRVLVRIGHPERPPERLGSGEALIDGGAFELYFPAVWDVDLYKAKLALIDVDGDGACDLSVDRLFGDSRAAQAEELIVSPVRGRYSFTEEDATSGTYYCDTWFNREWPLE
jgi:hypothetical protein